MKKLGFKSYFAGAISVILITALLFSVSAASSSKTLNVSFNDIKINIAGKSIVPKDANGNKVEPFIVDGTTYLPVRAVGEAFNNKVSWDGKTNTVNLAKKIIGFDDTNISWNLSISEIFKLYGENTSYDSKIKFPNQDSTKKRVIAYDNNKLLDYKAQIYFWFNDNKLSKIEYVLMPAGKLSTVLDYYQEYFYLKGYFTNYYGSDYNDKNTYNNTSYSDKSNANDMLNGYFNGGITLNAIWNIDNSFSIHLNSFVQDDVSMIYYSIENLNFGKDAPEETAPEPTTQQPTTIKPKTEPPTEPTTTPTTTPSDQTKLTLRNSKEVEKYIRDNYKGYTYTTQHIDGLDTITKDNIVRIGSVSVLWSSPEKINFISIRRSASVANITSNTTGLVSYGSLGSEKAGKDFMKNLADDLINKLPGIEIASANFYVDWYDYPNIKEGYHRVNECSWRTVNGKFEWCPQFDDE